jgi:hypothetical protein
METAMNDQLEADLREALVRRASGVPGDVGERLRSIDYHPRASRISPRLRVGSLAGAAVTTGTVISVVVLGGTSPAFAGWTVAPTGAPAAQTATAGASCQAQLASAPALAGQSLGGPWTQVATDVRGPFTLVVFQDGAAGATCLIGPSVTAVSISTGSGATERISGSASGGGPAVASSSVSVVRPSSADLVQMTTAHLETSGADPYTVVDGQIDAGVTGVTLVRSDGEDIEASSGSGWFVAWWPGSLDATSAQVTTANGVTTEPLDTPAPPASGNGACSGTASGACSGGSGGGPGA